MLYKKTEDYIQHQKETLKYIELNPETETNNCELIIECLRQCNILIKYCFNNLSQIKVPDKFRQYVVDNFIKFRFFISIESLRFLLFPANIRIGNKRFWVKLRVSPYKLA